MAIHEESGEQHESRSQEASDLFDSLELVHAIEAEEFRHFLDHIPIAIVISKLLGNDQRIIYANNAFEALFGQTLETLRGQGWSALNSLKHEDDPQLTFREAVRKGEDFIGTFQLDVPKAALIEAYACHIRNESGAETYRIVALFDVTERERAQREEVARRLREKDLLLMELQHRVKNNLQIITAFIRFEARSQQDGASVNLEKLAGRIESLQLLYRDLSVGVLGHAVDLGHYLGQIASAVIHAHGVDGIRLDMKLDHAMASINVAMPVGLLVNEVLTNAFKYAFVGRGNGTITLQCLHEDETRYGVVVADDGVGLPEGMTWPLPGKLSALIVQTLRENANTDLAVETAPGQGTRITINFQHKAKLPKPN
ncbi:MAG TPA: histidine kinase dimerization/phosphoacceptor domain -containing protein [Xanthobacteraceae bacterium]|jgi:PAS domain S-box-containing protein